MSDKIIGFCSKVYGKISLIPIYSYQCIIYKYCFRKLRL